MQDEIMAKKLFEQEQETYAVIDAHPSLYYPSLYSHITISLWFPLNSIVFCRCQYAGLFIST